MDHEPRVIDYEGSSYKTDFWDGQGREYEDLAERIALEHLLPPTGRRLLDIGAGFGRLSQFYEGYDQVILLDYSRSLLRQAQERLGRDGRIFYVAASFYDMPFPPGAIDTAMMVRVIHHVADVPRLLDEVARVLVDGGSYVLEFASKRNLKAMARHALGKQAWSPYDHSPVEFVEMNFDFHPAWMLQRLAEAGFHVKHQRTVSHFRLPLLKRLIPPRTLAQLDGLCQPTGAWWQLTPSIFLDCVKQGSQAALAATLFSCPACGQFELQPTQNALICANCNRSWPIEDGIYNFKDPLP